MTGAQTKDLTYPPTNVGIEHTYIGRDFSSPQSSPEDHVTHLVILGGHVFKRGIYIFSRTYNMLNMSSQTVSFTWRLLAVNEHDHASMFS